MDSEYPPLPPSGAVRPSFENLSLNSSSTIVPASERRESPSYQPREHDSSRGQLITKIISRNGDVVVDYIDRDRASGLPEVSYRWRVASGDLTKNSPYFGALLDPNKFSEGRKLLEQKMNWSLNAPRQSDDQKMNHPSDGDISALPRVNLPVDDFTRRLGVDAIELFLRILSFNSLTDKERAEFEGELKFQATSLVSRLVEVADIFNSPNIVRELLRRSGYAFGKGKILLNRFNPSLLKMSEDRIRQIIFIAHFLDEQSTFQIFTHALIVVGSKFWINGVEPPVSDALRWRYFSGGLEEELYYRRQCVLNTITDLQAYFLRVYGAIEEVDVPTNQTVNVPSIRPRPFQCRWGFGDSSACDIFNLGQMTRFFAMRTKTVFLGSSLIDPDFTLDPEDHTGEDGDDTNFVTERPQSGPPADITTIIASLKQFPDYQIDANHVGCGVRRRIIPALDCIEKFVGDGRGLMGIVLRHPLPLSSTSWSNRSLQKAHTIDIRSSRIKAFRYSSPGAPSSQEDEARLFFTARTRNWEA